jgi:predicted nucleic acid-binding protein
VIVLDTNVVSELMRKQPDARVLAYALDSADTAKQQRAHHLLAAHGSSLVISTQVLLELHAVCRNKLGMDAQGAAAAVRAAANLDVVPADRSLMLDAVAMATEHDLSVFDAVIVCAAIRAECEQLLSEDVELSAKITGIDVLDPFSP